MCIDTRRSGSASRGVAVSAIVSAPHSRRKPFTTFEAGNAPKRNTTSGVSARAKFSSRNIASA